MMKPLTILCNGRSEEKARIVCAYLVDQITMAKHAKLSVRQVDETDPSFYPRTPGRDWIVEIPNGSGWEQYTTTITKMQEAAMDFEHGWDACLKFLEEQKELEIAFKEFDKMSQRRWKRVRKPRLVVDVAFECPYINRGYGY